MRKLITIMLLLLLVTPCLRGQRKEISQARSYIKSGRNLNQAEKLMKDLIDKDSLNKINPKIYQTWYQVIKKQYDIENEKLYLNQKCDTALVYDLTQRMLNMLLTVDSLDAMPDKKGRVKPTYRKENAKTMDMLRLNLFYGGTFNINKSNYKKAFTFFDSYLDCVRQPLFYAYDYANKDKKIIEAAYWATFCGFKSGDPDLTLKYSDIARKDSVNKEFTLSYIAEAHSIKKDTVSMLNTLKEGFELYPLFTYYFPRLLDYYTITNQKSNALDLADSALKKYPKNELFLFAKSSVLLNMGRYSECIDLSNYLISLNDTLPESYLNAGTAYLNQVLDLEKGLTAQNTGKTITANKQSNERKKQITELYQKALPYIEHYRKLAPKAQDKWAPSLYRIYLQLNMGRQFDEIDALLNTK